MISHAPTFDQTLWRILELQTMASLDQGSSSIQPTKVVEFGTRHSAFQPVRPRISKESTPWLPRTRALDIDWEGETGDAAASSLRKELLCRGKPSYLDSAEAYTQREVFVALLAPRQLR